MNNATLTESIKTELKLQVGDKVHFPHGVVTEVKTVYEDQGFAYVSTGKAGEGGHVKFKSVRVVNGALRCFLPW